jgi:hypothetical protein
MPSDYQLNAMLRKAELSDMQANIAGAMGGGRNTLGQFNAVPQNATQAPVIGLRTTIQELKSTADETRRCALQLGQSLGFLEPPDSGQVKVEEVTCLDALRAAIYSLQMANAKIDQCIQHINS